jgi:hypothetical protein
MIEAFIEKYRFKYFEVTAKDLTIVKKFFIEYANTLV